MSEQSVGDPNPFTSPSFRGPLFVVCAMLASSLAMLALAIASGG